MGAYLWGDQCPYVETSHGHSELRLLELAALETSSLSHEGAFSVRTWSFRFSASWLTNFAALVPKHVQYLHGLLVSTPSCGVKSSFLVTCLISRIKMYQTYYVPFGKLTQLWKDPPFWIEKSTINGHVPCIVPHDGKCVDLWCSTIGREGLARCFPLVAQEREASYFPGIFGCWFACKQHVCV